jgi:hypothetical protein
MFTTFGEQLHNFMSWKTVECPFGKHGDLLNYLLASPIFTEKGRKTFTAVCYAFLALQVASYECESPETMGEREQFKKLRYENS